MIHFYFLSQELQLILMLSVALTGITFLLLAVIIFLSGFIASFIIEVVDQRAASGSIWDEIWVSDHVILGETVRTAVGFFEDKIDAFTGEEQGRIQPDQTSFWTGLSGSGASQSRDSLPVDSMSPMWRRALAHTIKGFSLVGIISFLQLSFSAAFLGPFGLRSSIFRMLNPRRGRRNDGRGGGVGIAELVLVSFILVGSTCSSPCLYVPRTDSRRVVVKAVKQLYSLVHYMARKLLARFEVMIMEVQ